jgi:cellobiose phosphorylase
MWKVCLEYILGVRPQLDGLLIDPCIPQAWDSFRVKRDFREATYRIAVENPEHVSKGIKKIIVDGQEQPANLVPPFRDGKIHEVQALMGHEV